MTLFLIVLTLGPIDFCEIVEPCILALEFGSQSVLIIRIMDLCGRLEPETLMQIVLLFVNAS